MQIPVLDPNSLVTLSTCQPRSSTSMQTVSLITEKRWPSCCAHRDPKVFQGCGPGLSVDRSRAPKGRVSTKGRYLSASRQSSSTASLSTSLVSLILYVPLLAPITWHPACPSPVQWSTADHYHLPRATVNPRTYPAALVTPALRLCQVQAGRGAHRQARPGPCQSYTRSQLVWELHPSGGVAPLQPDQVESQHWDPTRTPEPARRSLAAHRSRTVVRPCGPRTRAQVDATRPSRPTPCDQQQFQRQSGTRSRP